MFKCITKKYEDKIEELEWKIEILERQIENMELEWNEEKKLYDNITKQRFYEQKVGWTIGGIDMREAKEVNRPLYGLTEDDARTIAQLVKEKLLLQGIQSKTSFHWRESESCYVIDVEVVE